MVKLVNLVLKVNLESKVPLVILDDLDYLVQVDNLEHLEWKVQKVKLDQWDVLDQ